MRLKILPRALLNLGKKGRAVSRTISGIVQYKIARSALLVVFSLLCVLSCQSQQQCATVSPTSVNLPPGGGYSPNITVTTTIPTGSNNCGAYAPANFELSAQPVKCINSCNSAILQATSITGGGLAPYWTFVNQIYVSSNTSCLTNTMIFSNAYNQTVTATQPPGPACAPPPCNISIVTSSLANATVNSFYSQAIAAQGGTPPYTWAVSGPPAGLIATPQSDQTDIISGTPTQSGTANVSIQVTDSQGCKGTEMLTLTVSPLCTVNGLSLETQNQLPWGPKTYDSSNLGLPPPFTIGQKGCALTSISMALQADTIFDNPLQLNTLFNAHGGYSPQTLPSGQRTANVIWPKDILLAHSDQSLAWMPLGDILGPSDAATAALNAHLCGQQSAPATQQPTPVIVGVKLDSHSNPGHYVVVSGQAANGDYTILDPGYGKTLLSQFGSFKVKGAIQDPSNLSFMAASAGDSVELMITDPMGNRTGIDLADDSSSSEIANSEYSAERVDTINANSSTTADPYVFHELTVMQPIAGNYSLVIQGRYAGTFSLTVESASSTGVVQPALTLFGGVEAGSSQTYSIPLDVNGVLIASAPSSGTECNGVYSGTFDGDVIVSTGQTCAFIGGGITGKVHVTGGSLSVSNAVIGSTIPMHKVGSFAIRPSIEVTDGILSVNNAVIDGDVRVHDGGVFAIGPSTIINGNLMVENTPSGLGLDVLCGATVHGDVLFRNNAVSIESGTPASCPGNTVDRSLDIRHNSATTSIYNNTVMGGIRDDNNTGATRVFGNTVAHILECRDNASISGGGNTAERKEDQCATF